MVNVEFECKASIPEAVALEIMRALESLDTQGFSFEAAVYVEHFIISFYGAVACRERVQ